jgi:glucokinase
MSEMRLGARPAGEDRQAAKPAPPPCPPAREDAIATELVAADIGGTNARFAFAHIAPDGAITLDEPITLATSEFVSLETAWEEFGRRAGRPLPRAASFAIAAPITGETLRMTNSSWIIHTGRLDHQLGLDRFAVLNDFAAVAHAVARAPDSAFEHVCGPDQPLPATGTISVVGPGTGLGVAYLHRFAKGGASDYHAQASEGGHVDFAPVDKVDDALLARLRAQYRRVSVERVAAGPGIVAIYETLAALEHREVPGLDDTQIWERGLEGKDALAAAAVSRFCMTLGSAAGDFALAHGASAVVIAGGVGDRLGRRLPSSGFAERFRAKGRYEAMMAGIPVRRIVLAQPGLFGAAAAFAKEHLPA